MVMVLSAVSAPMLKSEPGTLLETVAGMMQSGMQSSSNLALPSTSSRLPVKAWGGAGGWARAGCGQLPVPLRAASSPRHLKAADDDEPVDAEAVDVVADFLKVFLRQSPGGGISMAEPARGGGLVLGTPPGCSLGGKCHLFVPSLDPPSPVQGPTRSQPISSIWRGKQRVEGGTHKGFWGAPASL